jgi:hypothetical protein
MTDFVATVPTWVVLDDLIELLEVDTGQRFSSTHPCHIFINEAEAVAYAISIGWTPPEPDGGGE